MKTLLFAWRYLWSRPLGAALNVLLLRLWLASITLFLLVGFQLSKAFERDLAGIDLVVGAKGSPKQVVLGAGVARKLGLALGATFAGVLLLTAALSVFIALWTAVRERRADLALGQAFAAALAWGPQLDHSLLMGGML